MAISIGQSSSTENSVTIDIYGLNSNYPNKEFDIYLDGSFYKTYSKYVSTVATVLTIDGLSSNTAYQCELRAFYQNNSNYWPDPSSGENSAIINISTSGGSGGENWIISDVPGSIRQLSDGDYLREDSGYPQDYHIDRWQVQFDTSGTWEITASASKIFYAYLTTTNARFDDEYGEPISGIIGQDISSQYGVNFTTTTEVEEGVTYYFWLRTKNGSQNTENFRIYFNYVDTPTPSNAYFTCSSTINSISVKLHYSGSFYSATYQLRDSTDTIAIETIPNSNLDEITFNTSLTSNTLYYVNVYFNESSSQGGFIPDQNGETRSPVRTQQQSGEDFTYYTISEITVSNTSIDQTIMFSENIGYIVPITISYNGIVTIYTETNSTSVMDDEAYLTSSENVSYDKNGVVDSTSSYYIKYNDNGHGNGQFQMTINNTNIGTNTYYLWIKGKNKSAIATSLYIIVPDAPQQGCVYIYDGSRWRKAIPYIYNGNTWRQAEAYIYNGTSWKKCGE